MMYYVSMKDSIGGSSSRIIAMHEKEKYITGFVNTFFRGSKCYEISCVTNTEKDPDLYSIVRIDKKEGFYLPMWMIKYMEDEYDRMTRGLVTSMSTMYTLCKNNGDTVGMSHLTSMRDYFFSRNSRDDEESLKEKYFNSYLRMHWITIVPYDKRKFEVLENILTSMEYMHETDIFSRMRLDLDYT